MRCLPAERAESCEQGCPRFCKLATHEDKPRADVIANGSGTFTQHFARSHQPHLRGILADAEIGRDLCMRIFAKHRKNQQILHFGRHFLHNIEDFRQHCPQLRIALG